jgi:hypothetical protein
LPASLRPKLLAHFTPRLLFPPAGRYSPRMGTLYYGDNLDILRRYLKDETVDLVYLDRPFNSAQNYNASFLQEDPAAHTGDTGTANHS